MIHLPTPSKREPTFEVINKIFVLSIVLSACFETICFGICQANFLYLHEPNLDLLILLHEVQSIKNPTCYLKVLKICTDRPLSAVQFSNYSSFLSRSLLNVFETFHTASFMTEVTLLLYFQPCIYTKYLEFPFQLQLLLPLLSAMADSSDSVDEAPDDSIHHDAFIQSFLKHRKGEFDPKMDGKFFKFFTKQYACNVVLICSLATKLRLGLRTRPIH